MSENVIMLCRCSHLSSFRMSQDNTRCWFYETCRTAIKSEDEEFRNCREFKNAYTEFLCKGTRRNCAKLPGREKFRYEQRLRAKVLFAPKVKSFWPFVKRIIYNASSSILISRRSYLLNCFQEIPSFGKRSTTVRDPTSMLYYEKNIISSSCS